MKINYVACVASAIVAGVREQLDLEDCTIASKSNVNEEVCKSQVRIHLMLSLKFFFDACYFFLYYVAFN